MKMLVLIILVEAVLVAVAARLGARWLRMLAVVNMILVTITAKKLANFGFGVSNVSSLFYASVFLVQALIYFRYGQASAQKTIYRALFALVALVVLRFFMASVPAVPGNESIAGAYDVIAKTTPLIFAGSFFAFFLSSQVFLICMERIRAHCVVAYMTGVILAQMLDSLIFFGVVFAAVGDLTIEFAIVGFLVKVAFALLTCPLLFLQQRVKPDFT